MSERVCNFTMQLFYYEVANSSNSPVHLYIARTAPISRVLLKNIWVSLKDIFPVNSLSLLRPAGLDGHRHCDMLDKKFHNERCKAWVHYNGTLPKKWKLQQAIKKEPSETQLLFKTCKMALKETTSFNSALIFGSADIYYVPISLIEQASTLINLYSKVWMIACILSI